MWLKLLLLTCYILLLFILSRVVETLSWCEVAGYGGLWSRQLLDPMTLSVARLKALLEQRGVSYRHIVEKSELNHLVEQSGEVSVGEASLSSLPEESTVQTNFTSGAHFIEQVEDAKDSVWLVQVVMNQAQLTIVGDARWRVMRKKVSRFGVNTGVLDCSLDVRYCRHKNWKSPFLLLALPAQFEKKAAISMHHYSGPVREAVVLRWLRDRLAERLDYIKEPASFESRLESLRAAPLNPEIHAVLFSRSSQPPLFYSALSVKFPGRVKFSFVNLSSTVTKLGSWKRILQKEKIEKFPSYMIYSTEGNYLYGQHNGEYLSFWSMERLFRFLYPCLNDIFIISFIVANTMAVFEPFISNCGIFRRIGKFIWCIFKYNVMVIVLWLPIIGVFQMPYLDSVPLGILKLERIFSTSYLGTMLRGDYTFYVNKPLYVYISFLLYLIAVTALCKKFRDEEVDTGDTADWFNYTNMNTLAQMRPNNFIGPVASSSGYDLLRGLEIFGSRLSQPSTWLSPIVSSDYIQYLPTFRYTPVAISELAAQNCAKVEAAMMLEDSSVPEDVKQEDVKCECKKTNTCEKASTLHTSTDNCLPDTTDEKSEQHDCCAACDATRANKKFKNSSTDTSGARDEPDNHKTTLDSSQSESNDQHQSESRHAGSPDDPSNTSSCQAPCGRTSGFPRGYVESGQCVICLEDYLPLTMLCGLPCGHVFHETCIFSWLNTEKHFCPMCRWPSYKIPDSVSHRM